MFDAKVVYVSSEQGFLNVDVKVGFGAATMEYLQSKPATVAGKQLEFDKDSLPLYPNEELK